MLYGFFGTSKFEILELQELNPKTGSPYSPSYTSSFRYAGKLCQHMIQMVTTEDMCSEN
jgi:hypothetical protein